MKKELPAAVLMTELDVILDTRLATLIKHWPAVATRVIADGYYDRVCEKFPGVPFAEFHQRYAERDKTTLLKSTMTRFVKFAVEYAKGIQVNTVSSPHHFKPKLVVNTHPYDLSPVEEDIVLRAIVTATFGKMDVELVKMTYDQITIDYLDENCAAFCFYQFDKWLEVQFGRLKDLPLSEFRTIPDVTMLVPFTSFVDLNTVSKEHFENREKALEYIQLFVGAHYVPVELICPYYRITVPEETEEGTTA